MTKEPNKDFRRAVFSVVNDVVNPANLREAGEVLEATTRILALCKEMLVRGISTSGADENFNPIPQGEFDDGWNAYNDSLLKQLGEK